MDSEDQDIDSDQHSSRTEGFKEARVPETEYESSELGKRRERQTTKRRFELFHLLAFNECSREEILERLRDYYQAEIPDEAHGDVSSQAAERMFLRDIESLEKIGFEVSRHRRENTTWYSIVKGTAASHPFLFSQTELDVLILLHTLFADPTKYVLADPTAPLPSQSPSVPFAQDIINLIERLATALPPKQKREFDRWVRKPFVYLNLDIVTDYLPHRATIDKIAQAITHGRKISLEYAPLHRQSGTTPHKQVDPYYITRQDGHLYLIGYSYNPHSPELNRFYEYRVDRINAESIKILHDSIDWKRRRKPIEFRYRIDATIAKGGLSNRWLSQTVERTETQVDEEGKTVHMLVVRAQAYSEFRILQQLQKYGSKVELLDPPELREKMKQEIERMYELYHQ